MTDRYENIRKALAMGPTPGGLSLCLLLCEIVVKCGHRNQPARS